MNYKNLIRRCAALLCAVSMLSLSACADKNKNESSASDASSQAATAAPKVTLPASDEPESSSSVDDSSQSQTPSDITPCMWEVTSSKGTKITFLGSMHALRNEVYPLPDKIMQAYESADVLAVECDISSITSNFAAQKLASDNMFYKDGTTIKDHLSEETYQNLIDYVTACNSNIQNYTDFQLWALYNQMDSLAARELKLDSGEGIDLYFLDAAHDDDKEIFEVESAEFQYNLLINLPESTYQTLLESYSGESKDEIFTQLEETYEAWKTGDYDYFVKANDINTAIEEAKQSGEELTDEQIAVITDYNNKLLTERNKGMAEKAEQLLEGDKDVFYVVGAAHFAGEGGLIDLLEKDGYTAVRVEY